MTGGGANLLGIVQYFSGTVRVAGYESQPFSQLSYPSDLEPIVNDLASEFTVAMD